MEHLGPKSLVLFFFALTSTFLVQPLFISWNPSQIWISRKLFVYYMWMKINDLAWKTSRRIKENGPDLLAEFSRPPTASRVLSISKMTEKEIKRIDYQFVALPTELVFALDPYCLKTIAVMIDRESYWKSRNKVFNGYFTLSVEELAECLCL